MTTKHKLTLLAGTAIALAATPVLAQTVTTAQPDGVVIPKAGVHFGRLDADDHQQQRCPWRQL
ncbi:MAG: hypothetical protein R3E03_03530 [Novosphingobium sp.]